MKKQTEEAILNAAKELGFSPCKSIFKPPIARSKTIGLIILPVGKEWKHIQDVYYRGVPLVVVDRIMPELNCPSVGIENYSGSKESMDYLLERGHRTIACIQRLPDSWINNERVRAYRDALKNNNIPIDESLIMGDPFSQKNGYLEGKLLLSRPQKPTAIFALSHALTLGLLQVFRDEGLNVPEDVSLISFADLPISEYFELKVTIVKQPVIEMGLMAVNLLLDQINSPKRTDPVRIKLRTTFIPRESVKSFLLQSPSEIRRKN